MRELNIGRFKVQLYRLVPGQSRLHFGGFRGEQFDGFLSWSAHCWPVSVLAFLQDK